MLQLKNSTPFAAALAVFPNEQGIDTLYTIVKATFNVQAQLSLLKEQPEPQKKDHFWGDPADSSLRLASDYHTGKAAADVIMVGSAYSLDERAVRQLDVSLNVGQVGKTVRVFGDRYWEQGLISTPESFVSMPMVYERAYGGMEVVDGEVLSLVEHNPVGLGFAGGNTIANMDDMALPNLECPRHLIRDFRDAPLPACFGPIAASWQPRVAHAGTYDKNWRENRAPYLPKDYSPYFLNCAHPDLIYPGFLQGGEPVKIVGMHPGGEINFHLPRLHLLNRVTLGSLEKAAEFRLETLILEPNQLQFSLVWRSAFMCDKKVGKIAQVSVSMLR